MIQMIMKKDKKKRKKKEKHDNLWEDKKEQVRKNDKKERWIKFYGRQMKEALF